jgi:spore germination protein YaaH
VALVALPVEDVAPVAVVAKTPPSPKTRHKLKRSKRFQIGCFGIFLAFFAWCVLDYYFYPWGVPVGAPSGNTHHNAIWLKYTHYFGEKTDVEIATLGKNLQEREITQAYFHVRFIQKDGNLRFRYPEKAQKLLATFRKSNTDPNTTPNTTPSTTTKAIAWIYAGNPRGEGAVDLHNPAVRAKMVTEAKWLCETCGFDGVQWDYEICEDGNADLLSLLVETRAALPPGKTLGVCAPTWYPIAGIYGWSESYIGKVAMHVDSIAVMCYDTGFVIPRAYVWLTRQQVVIFTRSLAENNPRARVWIGVPTYGKGFFSHNPRAENIALALRGVREGLAFDGVVTESFGGVALFGDHTTDESEWEAYQKLWLRQE